MARASSSSPRAVLDLRSWRPRGGIRFPLGPSAQCPHNSPPPTSARPSPTLRASTLCDESSLEPWACLDESRAFSLAQSPARKRTTCFVAHIPKPRTHPKAGHPALVHSIVWFESCRHVTRSASRVSPPVPTSGSGWSRRAPGASFGSSAVKPPATPMNTWAPPRFVDDSTRARLEI